MDWYAALKLLHVICAVAWVGGGFTLMIAAELMRSKRGPRAMMGVVEATALLGTPFFVPVSLLTLLTGIATAWVGPGFSDLWIVLGLAGFAATFLNGLLMIKPRAEAIAALIEKDGLDSPLLLPAATSLMTIARFDYVMLALVIADMVVKPTLSQTWVLGIMLVVLVIGSAATLGRAARPKPAI